MTGRIEIPNPPSLARVGRSSALRPAPAAREASFHASLRDCAIDYVEQPESEPQKSFPFNLAPNEQNSLPAIRAAAHGHGRGRKTPCSRKNNCSGLNRSPSKRVCPTLAGGPTRTDGCASWHTSGHGSTRIHAVFHQAIARNGNGRSAKRDSWLW